MLPRGDPDAEHERHLRGRCEFVHVDCPEDPVLPFGDVDERLVFADWLEQRGELDRAAFARSARPCRARGVAASSRRAGSSS